MRLQIINSVCADAQSKQKPHIIALYMALAFTVNCLLNAGTAQAESDQARQILVLQSYDPTAEWTKSVLDGIEPVLKQYKGKINLDVEYMDTRRINDQKHYENLCALYKHKTGGKHYDVIIAVNNNALLFLLQHRNELYPNIPIVFCCIGDLPDSTFQEHRLLTGTFQKKMLEPTVEIALKLHPSARQMVFINYSRTQLRYSMLKKNIDIISRKFSGRAEFTSSWLSEPTVEELLRAINGLGDESIVIFTSLFKDSEGNRYSFKDASDIILQRCSAPIYVLTEQWFGYGPIVGGKTNSGFNQGRAAAEMAMRILNGEDPENIPIVQDGLDKYVFDYIQMKRFGISPSDLPEGSTILNEPKSFYYLYKIQIWMVTAIIVGLMAMIAILSVNILRRRQAEKKLLDYQAKLKSLTSELSLTEEHERHRLATELHDRISQLLVISKVKLETLCESTLPEDLANTLDEVCNSLGQTIQNTRSLTFDLSSPILYELGFEAAVAEWLTEQIEQKYGIASEFEGDGQPKPLDDDISAMLFRDVRELLINVVKHAQAHKVKVTSRKIDSQIHISVEDDGVGFNVPEAASKLTRAGGFGLFSIRERLEQLGGHLEIKSRPGSGTKVTVIAPLKQRNIDKE